jgi:hypothetical protein
MQLRPVSYKWNDLYKSKYPTAQDTDQFGFIAQDLEVIFPDLVNTNADGYKSVKYYQVIPLLTKAIQELWGAIQHVVAWFSSDGSQFKVQGDVCVDDVCITKEQFKNMIMNAGAVETQYGPANNDEDHTESDNDTEEEATSTPQTDTDDVPEDDESDESEDVVEEVSSQDTPPDESDESSTESSESSQTEDGDDTPTE